MPGFNTGVHAWLKKHQCSAYCFLRLSSSYCSISSGLLRPLSALEALAIYRCLIGSQYFQDHSQSRRDRSRLVAVVRTFGLRIRCIAFGLQVLAQPPATRFLILHAVAHSERSEKKIISISLAACKRVRTLHRRITRIKVRRLLVSASIRRWSP